MEDIIVNAALILIALVIIIGGTKKGFVKILLKPLELFGALICAWKLGISFGDTVISPVISSSVSKNIADVLAEKAEVMNASNLSETLPSILKMAAGLFGISLDTVAEGSTDVYRTVVDALTAPVIHLISSIIGIVLMFIICLILFTILGAIINALMQKGALGVINRILGFLVGVIFAFIIVWITVALADAVFAIPSVSQTSFAQGFEGKFIYGFFRRNGPIELLLSF